MGFRLICFYLRLPLAAGHLSKEDRVSSVPILGSFVPTSELTGTTVESLWNCHVCHVIQGF